MRNRLSPVLSTYLKKPMSTNIPIVFSTDNNYVMPTGVAIFSLLESAKPTTVYDIFVLINDDVTEESKNLLRKQVACFRNHTIGFISVGKVFENSFEIRDISIATYSRLLIPWLLPQYDKVIYADVDMIFRIDLSDVYSIEMKDNLIVGVIDFGLRFKKKAVKLIKKIGLNVDNYINAGFLMFNSNLQREQDLMKRYLDEATKKYNYQDQDIINKVCYGKILRLSPVYNLSPDIFEMTISNVIQTLEAYEDSALMPSGLDSKDFCRLILKAQNCILHYTGSKPWNTFTPGWREWWNTYQHSIFYDPEREIKISNSILRPKQSWRSIAIQIKRKLFH